MIEQLTLFGVLFAGILSFLSPCVLPLVPPYLCFLTGTSLEQLENGDEEDPALPRRVMLSSALFVLGFTTIFVMLGASASFVGQFILSNAEFLSKVAGVIVIGFGLHFLGVFKLALVNREVRYQHDKKPPGILGAYLVGVAFAFGWTPCIGPVLAVVLAVASTQDTLAQGAGLLMVYSLGLGIPFMLASLGVKPLLRFMARFRQHIGKVEKVMGGVMVIVGVMFINGSFTTMSYWFLETFPSLATIG